MRVLHLPSNVASQIGITVSTKFGHSTKVDIRNRVLFKELNF